MTPAERIGLTAAVMVIVLAAITYLVALTFVALRQRRQHQRREAYDDAVNDRLIEGEDSPRNRSRR